MYLLYADDAGNTGTDYDNPDQPIFCLTGVIVPDDQWNHINNRIDDWKRATFKGQTDCEIHAVEIFNGMNNRKTGMNFRHNSLKTNLSILEGFIDLVVDTSLPFLSFSVKKRNLKAYCKEHFGSGVKIDPYFIALPYVLSFFDSYLKSRKAYGIVFLDEQDQIYHKIDNVLDSFRVFADGSSVLHADKVIERAMFLESKKSNFVQVADVFNFIINRRQTLIEKKVKVEREKDKFIFDMYKKIRPCLLDEPFDPKKSMAALKFFNDNYHLMQ